MKFRSSAQRNSVSESLALGRERVEGMKRISHDPGTNFGAV